MTVFKLLTALLNPLVHVYVILPKALLKKRVKFGLICHSRYE